MSFGICEMSLVPMRKEPSHRSELVSQILFGEHYEIVESQKEWFKIRTSHDGYEGFISLAQHTEISYNDFQFLQKTGAFVCFDLVQLLLHDNKIQTVILGSALPFFENQHCRINTKTYRFDGNAKFPQKAASSALLIENAYMYLNAPYLWGGRSPFGVDCSGFTQLVYKLSGYSLLRDASLQAEQGSIVNLVDEAMPGDLAFFDNEEGHIIHVGILTSRDTIIHASGKVRIDAFDQVGIYNQETKRYTHKLRLIKRIF
ncbi:MAG: C40 family peptidase [Bacteroidia bacterium]|jgi:hypothetical protein